ncbi:uncharacterized protein A4U43_C04F2050 [Asparagus officinalis]|uniref:Uncharacterized protein n=1 Tax=Asparagus officinalis TaxID=4686 RepID=A0A5P1EXJ0_ASPOF|nr:uncharacterized protein A4U43_C04F2050 [Asparagus officinalis]
MPVRSMPASRPRAPQSHSSFLWKKERPGHVEQVTRPISPRLHQIAQEPPLPNTARTASGPAGVYSSSTSGIANKREIILHTPPRGLHWAASSDYDKIPPHLLNPKTRPDQTADGSPPIHSGAPRDRGKPPKAVAALRSRSSPRRGGAFRRWWDQVGRSRRVCRDRGAADGGPLALIDAGGPGLAMTIRPVSRTSAPRRSAEHDEVRCGQRRSVGARRRSGRSGALDTSPQTRDAATS